MSRWGFEAIDNKPVHSIYGLVDPHTKKIRYVGKSKHPEKRLSGHLLNKSLRGKNLSEWLECLDKKPELIILASGLTPKEAHLREAFYIDKLLSEGAPLLNATIPKGYVAVGETIGKLLVLGCGSKKIDAKCLDCDKRQVVWKSLLKECFCYNRSTNFTKKRQGYFRNSLPSYRAWQRMKERCNNPKYKKYFGIIKYDPHWEQYENFLEDMGEAPAHGYELDRKDNAGHYNKENCRWVTKQVNSNNRSSNRRLDILGESLTIAEASRKYGISQSTIWSRLCQHGKCGEDLVKPVKN